MATRRVFAYSKWNINFLKVGGQKWKKRSLAAAKKLLPVWQMMRKNWYGFYICARSRWRKHRLPACCISHSKPSINANKKYWEKWKPFGCRKVHQRLIRLRNAFKLRIESTDIPFAWYSIVEYKEYSFDAGFDKIASIWFVGAPSVRISWSKQVLGT